MIAKTSNLSVACTLSIALFLLLQTGVGIARAAVQDETPGQTQREATVSRQEAIEAIKRRAKQIIAQRKNKRLRLAGEVTAGIGVQKNPGDLPSHKGDSFVESSLFLNLTKPLTPTLTWQGSYYGSVDNYIELTDYSYTYQTLTPVKLLWKPARKWRWDGGVDLGYLVYASDNAPDYKEFKPFVGVRQDLWGNWFHAFHYEYSLRHYLSKRARNGLGVNTRTHREDMRHKGRYEIGTVWKNTLFKGRGEYYLNDSNDARNDFYDAEDWKLIGSITRRITDKFSVYASYTFERKNYRHRKVVGVRAEARYDDEQTYALSGTYDFNKNWSLTPSFSYTRLNSNEPTGEYFDWTAKAMVARKF